MGASRLRRRRILKVSVRSVRLIVSVVALALIFGASTVAVAQSAPQANLRYTFEQGIKTDSQGRKFVGDSTGLGHKGFIRTANGGKINIIARNGGTAAKFPNQCDPSTQGSTCPKVLIQAKKTNPDDLNPGPAPFSFGADVKIDGGSELTLNGGGMNIVQKGLIDTPGGQWKLQIDSTARPARPACFVREGGARITATAQGVDVADNLWHSIECKKDADSLSIWIDDVQRGSKTLSGISVSTTRPVTVGAKWLPGDPDPNNPQQTLGPINDQFHGALDNVFFSLD